jgi:hypothetical protein
MEISKDLKSWMWNFEVDGEPNDYLIKTWQEMSGELRYADKESVKKEIIEHSKFCEWDESYSLEIWDVKADKELKWKKLIEVKEF